MTTAFVLSGGGSLGAVQVGMLDALAERDIAPDLLVGTSVGAINAAYIARRGFDRSVVGDLAAIWRGLRRHDVFPLEPLRLAAAAVGRAPSLCSDGALRRLVTSHAGDGRLEELALPVHVIATDVTSGVEVVLSSGDAVQAVMASAAIPAVFPSVHIDGRYLVDGGVSNNAPVSHALSSGVDVVYVLPTGFACALDDPPTSPLASAVQALTLLIQQRLIVEVGLLASQADIRVLPPLCPLAVSSADFDHTGELIDRARAATGQWLDGGGTGRSHPERFLSLHDHRSEHHDAHRDANRHDRSTGR